MSWAEQPEAFPNTRPKDAATLIMVRRDPRGIRILMGRRSDAHVFMPGATVFPGGRVDRGDRFAASLDALHPTVEAQLGAAVRKASPERARAIALAAIRETFEETGILIGKPATVAPKSRAWAAFLERGMLPTLAPLRLVARAITPPRMSRRFDTRFFVVSADAIGAEATVADQELQCPAWLTFDEARAEKLPWITRTVLDGLEARLRRDPDLQPGAGAPFYFARHGKRCVEML